MDETNVIPVIKTGIERVNQVSEGHSVSVIVSALSEASALVSNAYGETNPVERQKAYSEAQECAEVALTFLATVLKSSTGMRVRWNAGYETYQGTIVQTMDDGRYMVVPDGSEALYIHPSECEIIL